MYTRQLSQPTGAFFLFGPRGVGKSFWLRQTFRDAHIIDLLPSRVALDYLRDPSLLEKEVLSLPQQKWIVIDEIQKVPSLLDEVHSLMENHGYKKFVLTGSSARKLRHGASNLLAGRAILRKMFPLTSHEINYSCTPEQILKYGLMPLSVLASREDDKREYLESYVDTYLREEIKEEGLVRKLDTFVRFLDVAASVAGQLVNVSNTARETGTGRETARGHFSILIDTLMGNWLPAYRPRAKIKEVAHPKFYWFDTGVLRALAGGFKQPLSQDWKGVFLEHWMFHELSAYLNYSKMKGKLAYWRTPSGAEIDFIWWYGKKIIAIELKAAKVFHNDFMKGIRSFSESQKPHMSYIVYLGDKELKVDSTRVLPVMTFLKLLYQGHILSD